MAPNRGARARQRRGSEGRLEPCFGNAAIVVRHASGNPSLVMIVADNPATLETLHSYFGRVGVTSSGSCRLGDASGIPPAATALVLFPDDFGRPDVQALVLTLRRARPRLLIVLVSSAPQDLGPAVEPDGHSLPPVVLPRPAFGWTILDTIRNRAAEPEAD
jgi:hypothetical protein